MMTDNFKFNISLSVLDHLGRNLYRSFATVLGEAVSNSWDADAHTVNIYLDRDKNTLCIKDDGDGMNAEDFQDKFLKIGYSKRKADGDKSPGGRPFIGRKGIGKLALLSCAKKISVKSKVSDGKYVGGTIDNTDLDQAIKDDVSSHNYELDSYDDSVFKPFDGDHEEGTIIFFEGIKDAIHNADDFLKKIIALYFRFSLVDSSFKIFLNEELVTLESLKPLADKTQFVWNINNFADPYLDLCTNIKETIPTRMDENVKGFIGSVEKPRHRNIHATGERVSIDLFVNGRLRETDILRHRHLSSLKARVPESYLYGQIHLDDLDSGDEDPFTSNREEVKEESKEYGDFLEKFRKILLDIIENQWDVLREKYNEEGDPDNPRKTPAQRGARTLFRAVASDYQQSPESVQPEGIVNTWKKQLFDDAEFNFETYAQCFTAENLVRRLWERKTLSPDSTAKGEIDGLRRSESAKKRKADLSIQIRSSETDPFYLDMEHLARIADRGSAGSDTAGLRRTEKRFTPLRDAIMHTSLLTNDAKQELTSVFNNIKARIQNLL